MTTTEHARAIYILGRLEREEPVGIIDTIYIYLWVFAVSEFGEALKLTMYTAAIATAFISAFSYLSALTWNTVIFSFAVALSMVLTTTGVFGFVIALLIMICMISIGFLYMVVQYMGWV